MFRPDTTDVQFYTRRASMKGKYAQQFMSDCSIQCYMKSMVCNCIFLPEDGMIGSETCWII